MLVRPGGDVEERSLAAIRVAHQCHADHTVTPLRHPLHLFVHPPCVVAVRGVARKLGSVYARQVAGFGLADYFDAVGLLPAQRDFVADDFIFYGILQRRVEHHLHPLAVDEAHLGQALLETAAPVQLDDDAVFTRL